MLLCFWEINGCNLLLLPVCHSRFHLCMWTTKRTLSRGREREILRQWRGSLLLLRNSKKICMLIVPSQTSIKWKPNTPNDACEVMEKCVLDYQKCNVNFTGRWTDISLTFCIISAIFPHLSFSLLYYCVEMRACSMFIKSIYLKGSSQDFWTHSL